MPSAVDNHHIVAVEVDGDSGSDAWQPPSRPPSCASRQRGLLLLFALALVGTVAVGFSVSFTRSSSLTKANPTDAEKKWLLKLALAAAEEIAKVERIEKDTESAEQGAGSMSELLLGGKDYNDTELQEMAKKYNSTQLQHLCKSLNGTYNTSDGNVCADDEELLSGLCYKRCSLLTGGAYAVRRSAFACCRAAPCHFYNTRFRLLSFCGGFDVAGDQLGGGCPHPPGGCLGNEELYMGQCMMDCKWLTQGQFPFRVGLATCCKVNSALACMESGLSNTSAAFAVGGGSAYSNSSASAKPHSLIREVTERLVQ